MVIEETISCFLLLYCLCYICKYIQCLFELCFVKWEHTIYPGVVLIESIISNWKRVWPFDYPLMFHIISCNSKIIHLFLIFKTGFSTLIDMNLTFDLEIWNVSVKWKFENYINSIFSIFLKSIQINTGLIIC